MAALLILNLPLQTIPGDAAIPEAVSFGDKLYHPSPFHTRKQKDISHKVRFHLDFECLAGTDVVLDLPDQIASGITTTFTRDGPGLSSSYLTPFDIGIETTTSPVAAGQHLALELVMGIKQWRRYLDVPLRDCVECGLQFELNLNFVREAIAKLDGVKFRFCPETSTATIAYRPPPLPLD